MSTFVPKKRNLREGLLLCFHLKKKAVEAQQTLTEAYRDYVPSKKGLKVVILIRKTKSVRASQKV
jgi:HTH domain in Mos1 transposase